MAPTLDTTSEIAIFSKHYNVFLNTLTFMMNGLQTIDRGSNAFHARLQL
ncbi:hypothetical protein GGD46_004472 [Rhizobium lusitanum]|uniref:Uncharacterized protein n=1 Tax=Rhizobium lusitanum TaxID=293958 RepID=A0A7X0IWT2_9HYPH|nr:hypothetical protein [Rhizobium lusitanum]